ncbi:MAG: host-nuclease inhibitor Gam family protein [Phycisphaeraceae bacterium]
MLTSPKPASAPPDEGFEVPCQFRVQDHQSANWVVRKVIAARQYAQRIEEWATAETQRARQEETYFMRRFEAELRAWFVGELAHQPGKAKSINLPAGRVGIRRRGPKIEVADQAVVLAWAADHCPAAIKRTESILKTPLTEHFEATGELPDGVVLHDAIDVFYIN